MLIWMNIGTQSGARIIGASRRICMSRIRDLFWVFDVSLQKKKDV